MFLLRDNYSFNIYMLILIDHQLCVMVLGPNNKIMKTVRQKQLWPHAAYDLVGGDCGKIKTTTTCKLTHK